MKIIIKYNHVEVEFEGSDDWAKRSKEILKELKGVHTDDSEYEKF